jgi:hypothetical protein
MFKQLITWFYERYCKEPEYAPTQEDYKRFLLARSIHREFGNAGYVGKPKPDYPEVNGKQPSESVKKQLDQIYEDAKQKGNSFNGVAK